MSRGVTAEIVNTINSRWVRDITAGVEATTSKVNQSNALHFCSGETVNCPSVNVRISSSRLPGPDAITHSWPTIKWDGWLLSPPSPSGLLYTWTPNVVLFCSFVLFFVTGLQPVMLHHMHSQPVLTFISGLQIQIWLLFVAPSHWPWVLGVWLKPHLSSLSSLSLSFVFLLLFLLASCAPISPFFFFFCHILCPSCGQLVCPHSVNW